MDNFIKLIENEITYLDKKIQKDKKLSSIKLIDSSKQLLELSNEEYNKIYTMAEGEISLTANESMFLHEAMSLEESAKEFLCSCLDAEQLKIINSIIEKINRVLCSCDEKEIVELENTINQYKNLLKKARNNGLEFITEFSLISELFDKYDVSFEDRISTLKEINSFNNEINSKFVTSEELLESEEIIDESELDKTNLDSDKVEAIFNKYGLSFKENLKSYTEYVLAYGNYDKIDSILAFICNKKNDMLKVLNQPEILSKILIHSSVEILSSVIKLEQENGLTSDAHNKNMTILFPAVRSISNYRPRRKGSKAPLDNKVTSGNYKNFANNIVFLNEHGIEPSVVEEKCVSFFTFPNISVRKSYEHLLLYGINPFDKEHRKVTYSVFRSHDCVLKNLDIAIEAGAFEYIRNNLSRLSAPSKIIEVYSLKNECKKNKGDFRYTPYCRLKESDNLYLNSQFPLEITFDTINEEYGAVNYDCPDKDIFDEVLSNSYNSTISSLSMEDELIKEIDSIFKVDDYMYDFNGVIISRKKVLRFYETFISNSNFKPSRDLILYVITKNSLLDENELESIKKCINKLSITNDKTLIKEDNHD